MTLGCIGTGNNGVNWLRNFMGDDRVQVVSVCDVCEESAAYWANSVRGREPARKLVEEKYGKGCKSVEDFREVLADGGVGCGADRDTRPLARHPRDLCGEGGQAHLWAETTLADDRRGPGDVGCGQSSRCHLPDRGASSVRASTSARPSTSCAMATSARCIPSKSGCQAARPTTRSAPRRPRRCRCRTG